MNDAQANQLKTAIEADDHVVAAEIILTVNSREVAVDLIDLLLTGKLGNRRFWKRVRASF